VRVTQGLLPFQYESEAGLSDLARIPFYLELWRSAGLEQSVAGHVAVTRQPGLERRQMVSELVLLNLGRGEALDDLDRLEVDGGLCRLVPFGSVKRVGGAPRRGRSSTRIWLR
jgi:hypothetical protein